MDDNSWFPEKSKKLRKKGSADLRYCKRCGKAFPSKGEDDLVCPDCIRKEQEDFERVKELLRDRPSSEEETIEATGVSKEFLNRWIRDERLAYTDGISPLRCEICGKNIRTGRYCDECRLKLSKKGYADTRFPEKGRVRFMGDEEDE